MRSRYFDMCPLTLSFSLSLSYTHTRTHAHTHTGQYKGCDFAKMGACRAEFGVAVCSILGAMDDTTRKEKVAVCCSVLTCVAVCVAVCNILGAMDDTMRKERVIVSVCNTHGNTYCISAILGIMNVSKRTEKAWGFIDCNFQACCSVCRSVQQHPRCDGSKMRKEKAVFVAVCVAVLCCRVCCRLCCMYFFLVFVIHQKYICVYICVTHIRVCKYT